MSAQVCPTITATNPHEYRAQLERVQALSQRIHVDLMDGTFASPRSVSLHELHWPEQQIIDLHVMYQHPARYLASIAALQPYLVILHAEADGDFMAMAEKLHSRNIRVGVALLAPTPAASIIPALEVIDHVLIFSGNLGHQGGSVADLHLLAKGHELRAHKPELELGWDGGINASNIGQLAQAGIDVLNVGGFIQHALHPAEAYATLKALA